MSQNGPNVEPDPRVALVTGGSRGIGRAISKAFAATDAKVAFCYLRDDDAARETSSEIRAAGLDEPLALRCDLTVAEERERLVSDVETRLGPVTILVNNAGTTADGVATRMKQSWDELIALDLTVPFRLAQLVLRGMMRAKWGRIVNVGSVASRVGFAGQTNYTAAKAGLEGMTRSLAQEYGRKGITVNTVSPGFVETDLTWEASDHARDYVERYSASGRFVTPAEVADVVAFLASDRSRGITGQTLHVDGGLVKL